MDATASFLSHQCPRLRPAIPTRRPSLPASPLHLQHHRGGSRPHPLRSGLPGRRSPNVAAGAAVALWGWASGRRKRGRKGGGLDMATLERWASILLLAGSIRSLLVMQPLEALAVLLENGGGTRIGGGGRDGVVGLLNRAVSGGGNARKRNRAWKRALGLAVKAASAAAAVAAIWLLLFGKRLL